MDKYILQEIRKRKCTVEQLLEEWGAWSRTGIGTGSLEEPTSENVHWISDDIGLWIESAVNKLREYDGKRQKYYGMTARNKKPIIINRHKAIICYYKKRYNYDMLASALQCGRNKAITVLVSAHGYLENELGMDELVA